MGIQGFNKFLKEKGIEYVQNVRLVDFAGYRIAIDGCGWAYTHFAVGHKRNVYAAKDPVTGLDRAVTIAHVYNEFLKFNFVLMSYGITPVWIWDGTPPPEKFEEKVKRSQKKKDRKDDIMELHVNLEALSILERTKPMLDAFRKVLANYNTVSMEEMEQLRSIAEVLGIPSIQAPGEGEAFCASLAEERLVGAVWSTDTDIYAFGTEIQITGFNGADDDGVPLVEVTLTSQIREELSLTQEQLRDFCILCGCDFNVNIAGIGPKRSYDLIVKHASLEAISEARDTECLKYERCRELLSPFESGFSHKSPDLRVDAKKFTENGRDFLGSIGMGHQFHSLFTVITTLRSPQMVEVAEVVEAEVEVEFEIVTCGKKVKKP
jgi:flap endonuclease-1